MGLKRMGREEINLPLFADEMIIFLETSTRSKPIR